MAIYYLKDGIYTFYGENIQAYIDDGYGLPNDNNMQIKPKHIYNIVEPSTFNEYIGSSNKLFYVRPLNSWSIDKDSRQNANNLFNNKVAIKNTILNDLTICNNLQNIIDTDIEDAGYSLILTDNLNTNLPNNIYVINLC